MKGGKGGEAQVGRRVLLLAIISAFPVPNYTDR